MHSQVITAVAAAKVFSVDLTDLDQENRRRRLVAWIANNGGHAEVARARKLKPSRASYMSQVANGYPMGVRAASQCSKTLAFTVDKPV